MPTVEDRHTLALKGAKADESFWAGRQDTHSDMAEGHKELMARAEATIAKWLTEAAKAADRVAAANRASAEPRGRATDVPKRKRRSRAYR